MTNLFGESKPIVEQVPLIADFMPIERQIMQACKKRALLVSPCKKLKVGAIIVPYVDGKYLWDNTTSSYGVNSFQRDPNDTWLPQNFCYLPLLCEPDCRCGKARHAEIGAILKYCSDWWHLEGDVRKVLFTTHYPCSLCLQEVLMFGVTHIVMGFSKPNEEADSASLYQAMEEGLLQEVRFV